MGGYRFTEPLKSFVHISGKSDVQNIKLEVNFSTNQAQNFK